MRPDARERLAAAIARKNAERGRPLTAREKLDNLVDMLVEETLAASDEEILRDLARAKATFQLRAIETIIRGPASAMSGFAQDRETGLGPQGASAVPKGDAQ